MASFPLYIEYDPPLQLPDGSVITGVSIFSAKDSADEDEDA